MDDDAELRGIESRMRQELARRHAAPGAEMQAVPSGPADQDRPFVSREELERLRDATRARLVAMADYLQWEPDGSRVAHPYHEAAETFQATNRLLGTDEGFPWACRDAVEFAATVVEMEKIRARIVAEGPDALQSFDHLLFFIGEIPNDAVRVMRDLWQNIQVILADFDALATTPALLLMQAAARTEAFRVRGVLPYSFNDAFAVVFGDVMARARERVRQAAGV